MLKFKLLLIPICCVAFVHFAAIKQQKKEEPQIIDPNAKSIYFRTWKDAFVKDKTFQHLSNTLKTNEYGNY